MIVGGRRRTKIVCTLGPATDRGTVLRRLVRAGMDVARLNFSHGTRDEHRRRITHLRAEAEAAGRTVAVLQDLQGPKLRVGRLASPSGVRLKPGGTLTLAPGSFAGDASHVAITYSRLARSVRAGDRVLIDDGALELRVARTERGAVVTRVVRGGILRSHKGMNLPGRDLAIPALTGKDRADLAFGLEHGVDFIALSFVRRPDDMRRLKRVLQAAGKPVPVIAKLERPEAVRNLPGILAESSAVMVARGDLGVEMSVERVPRIQKMIIQQANACGCPAITATQMLESMIQSRQPTRAEASDVANAILDGTDAVMLSAETAAGAFPVEALEMMARIARAAESGDGAVVPAQPGHAAAGFAHALSHAARQIAHDDPEVKAIACYTKSGMTARLVSSDRPGLPIYAFAPDARVRRQLALFWGVTPLACPPVTEFEDLLRFMDHDLLQRQLLRRGDGLVVLAGAPLAFRNLTNSLRLHRVGEVRAARR